MNTENQTPAWEVCKENVLPIKRGRSAKVLSDSLARPFGLDQDDREQLFEDQLKKDNLTSPERLDMFAKYFKWVRDTFPSNSDRALKLLERCTCELKDVEELRNNAVFVKMWIEYADMTKTPGEVFAFMQSNKIGEKTALLWIAWAFVAEKATNFKLTDQIFQKGIKKQAEPKDVLQKRYQQFQRRMARHYLNGVETETTESLPPQKQATITASNSRKALSSISSQENTQQSSTRGLIVPPTTNSVANAGLQFEIFSDNTHRENDISSLPISRTQTNSIDVSMKSQLIENPHWNNFGTESSRRKENDGLITKWSEGGVTSQPVVANNVGPTFSIFLDESIPQPIIHAAVTDEHKGLSVRQMLDGSKKGLTGSDVERISRDPLMRHKPSEMSAPKPVSETSTVAAEVPVVESNNRLKATDSARDDKLTVPIAHENVNNKKISPPIESMERSKDSRQSVKIAPPAGSGFDIFCDNSAPSMPSNPTTSSSSSSSASSTMTQMNPKLHPTFAKTDRSQKTSAPVSSSSNNSSNSSSSMSFQIFSDSEAMGAPIHAKEIDKSKPLAKTPGNNKLADRPPTHKTAVICDDSFNDIKSVKKRNKMEDSVLLHQVNDEDEGELDDFLTDLGVLDSEDGTINTRLAKKDIDVMFCSPDNSMCSPCPATTRTGPRATANTAGIATGNMKCSKASNQARPFLTSRLDSMTGMNDLSAIKETSLEHSIFGSLSTPMVGGNNFKRMPGTSRSSFGDALLEYSDRESPMIGTSPGMSESVVHPSQRPKNVEDEMSSSTSSVQFDLFSELPTTIPNRRHIYNPFGSSHGTDKASPPIITTAILSQQTDDEDPAAMCVEEYLTKKIKRSRHQRDCLHEIQTSKAMNVVTPVNNSHPTARIQTPNQQQSENAIAPRSSINKLSTNDEFRTCEVNTSTPRVNICTPSADMPCNSEYQTQGLHPEIIVDATHLERDKLLAMSGMIDYLSENNDNCKVIDMQQLLTPPALAYRTKCSKSPTTWNVSSQQVLVQSCLGKGGYGYALLCHRRLGKSKNDHQPIVLKVDRSQVSTVWEALVHNKVKSRLQVLNDSILENIYKHHFHPPSKLFLYSDSSILEMGIGECGTLVHVMAAMNKGILSSEEHEVICANIAHQMMTALQMLHAVGIVHGDIKTDNWVVRKDSQFPGFAVCLIDFGKSLDTNCSGITNWVSRTSQQLTTPPSTANVYKSEDNIVKFHGNIAVKGLECAEMLSGDEWSNQFDYFGLCCCMHQLLFLAEMKSIVVSSEIAERRGYIVDSSHANRDCRIPNCSMKRYWRTEIWKRVFVQLLNPRYHGNDPLPDLLKHMQTAFQHTPLLKRASEKLMIEICP